MIHNLLPDFNNLRLKLIFSRKGHFILSTFSAISGLLVIAGLILQHLKGVSSTSWLIDLGTIMQLGAVLILLALQWTFQPIYSFELRYGAKCLLEELDAEEVERKIRAQKLPEIKEMIKMRRLSFTEMSFKRKLAYIGCFLFSIGLALIAILDVAGMIPPAKMKALDGTFETMPRWLTVSLELFGVVMAVVMLPPLIKWISLNPTDSRWWKKEK